MKKTQIVIKHSFDRGIALIGLVALVPLWFAIACAIKLEDGGPVFFRQTRLGLGGSKFLIWKFRSMVIDADRLLNENSQISKTNRITRVGFLLRKSSLDELPQLLNILKGEMSIIGPRPTLPEHWGRYSERQKRRFEMRPGVTGLAQVRGRNSLLWSQRIESDIEYIENYSLWLDAWILVRTVKVVFLAQGVVMDRNPEQVDDLAGGRAANKERISCATGTYSAEGGNGRVQAGGADDCKEC